MTEDGRWTLPEEEEEEQKEDYFPCPRQCIPTYPHPLPPLTPFEK
jgi:hypothetical protein